MMTLQNGMFLYHGSYTEVSSVKLSKCKQEKDFGHGFYPEWLHFVAANRRKSLFATMKQSYLSYDIIGGKIANDQTAKTLQLYTSGGYGVPGSDDADDIAIKTLLPNRLEDQFCFRNEKAIRTLQFIRSEIYDINSNRP